MKKLVPVLVVFMLLAGTVGCLSKDVPPPTISMPDKTRSISVFYATGNTLVEEKHVVKDDKDIIKTALNEVLAASPKENESIAIVQPECKVLDAKLDEKGLVTVNFSKEVLDFEAIRKEKVLAYGAILETLKQFEEIKSVKFLVEGKDKGTTNGKDIQQFWGDVSLIGQPWSIR